MCAHPQVEEINSCLRDGLGGPQIFRALYGEGDRTMTIPRIVHHRNNGHHLGA